MSDKVVQFPSQEPPEFIVGPFTENRVVIEGRMIPRLTAFREGDEVWLVVDGRFSVGIPKDIAHSVAWLIANALAVGEGYPCLSSESKERPFAPQSVQLDGLPRQ